MPLAAHRVAPGAERLGVDEAPDAAARGAGAGAIVVLGEPALEICGPTYIGARSASAARGEEHVDEGRGFGLLVGQSGSNRSGAGVLRGSVNPQIIISVKLILFLTCSALSAIFGAVRS